MQLRTLLLIDDEPDIRAVARISLERVGKFEVRTASSGAEGIELAAAHGPDLILLDMMMPEMDGAETLRNLRQRPETAGIPVVFMTAKVQPHEIQAYVELGALGVISKPFDPMQLPAEIRALAGEASPPAP